MDRQPLTTERLPTIPKLDKTLFISSYLQGQKAHAKSYAEQGRTLASSWHLHTTPKKPVAVHTLGFTTPVLTARVPRQASESQEGAKNKSSRRPPLADKEAKETQPTLKSKDNPEKRAQKPLSKKRGVESDPDEDQIARLLERRERKRIKRAIVQPKEPSESDTASSNGKNKPKKKTKAKGKKTTVPSGFALMHGFSATNVGKNRLTLKPPSNVGVFKKGKASFNTKIKPKPKAHRKHFSELGFLNNTNKATEPAASESSSLSVNSSLESSPEDMPNAKKKTPIQKIRPEKDLRTLTESLQNASELSKASALRKCIPAESEIWDIESRVTEKKIARQKTGSAEDASVSYIQGTVVVDACMPAWRDRLTTNPDPVVQVVQPAVEEQVPIPSSPSLRPSQSASQIIPLVAKAGPAEAASRYFPAEPQMKPPRPDNNPVKRTASLVPYPGSVEVRQDTDLPNIPAISCDLNNSALPTGRFVIPTRNRVFANQFPPIHAFWSPSPEPDPYTVAPVLTEDAVKDLHDYTGVPGTFTDGLEPDYALDEEANGNCIYPQSQVWHATADPDGPWAGTYDDEELEEFPVQYENAYEDFGSVESAGDGDCPGYSEDDYAQAEGGILDYGETDLSDMFQDPGSPIWGEVIDSMAVDGAEDATTGEDGNNFFDDQICLHSSAAFGGTGNFEDMASDSSGLPSTYTPRFAQGRALLLGLPIHEPADARRHASGHISHAEVDVAKALQHHWLPQRL
ncbi:hypothetical protein DFH07DRAFT_834592 [Mycena maculata]|uniref:Uncharacterized protein n=1 Tax=Mycena maculata TaxID=230809 RepID=A0AAD7N3Y8_9AGAR|nr:hypothetical protein DFH07DRAFT_834592 [Mycena maculata]